MRTSTVISIRSRRRWTDSRVALISRRKINWPIIRIILRERWRCGEFWCSVMLLCYVYLHSPKRYRTYPIRVSDVAVSVSRRLQYSRVTVRPGSGTRRWMITDDNAVFSEQSVDSRKDRECASGCERKLSSGAAEDSPAGGRGRDDLRAAGGRSVRPRHTKAVCVHCWILSTFSNVYMYIHICMCVYIYIYIYIYIYKYIFFRTESSRGDEVFGTQTFAAIEENVSRILHHVWHISLHSRLPGIHILQRYFAPGIDVSARSHCAFHRIKVAVYFCHG